MAAVHQENRRVCNSEMTSHEKGRFVSLSTLSFDNNLRIRPTSSVFWCTRADSEAQLPSNQSQAQGDTRSLWCTLRARLHCRIHTLLLGGCISTANVTTCTVCVKTHRGCFHDGYSNQSVAYKGYHLFGSCLW